MSPLHTVNTYIDIYIKIWSIYVDVSHKFCIRAMVFYFFSFILKLHLDFFFLMLLQLQSIKINNPILYLLNYGFCDSIYYTFKNLSFLVSKSG